METTKQDNIYFALSTFREKVSAVKKDADNPFFKSKYADLPSILEVIKEPLKESGLAITHHCKNTDGSFSVITTLAHHSTGETIESEFPVFGTKPQEIGSSMSYARRYNLLALLDIPTEDDDGNTANTAPRTKTQDTPTGGTKTAYFGKGDLARCESEGFASSKESIKQWAFDNGLTIAGPLQAVILHYLEHGEIIDPVFTKK